MLLFSSAAAPVAPVNLLTTGSIEEVKVVSASAPVVVFSKTYCPYCLTVKALFADELNVKAAVYELDTMGPVGAAVQDSLASLTGQRSVPNVFIGGKHVGGCDSTLALYGDGLLKPLLDAAGA